MWLIKIFRKKWLSKNAPVRPITIAVCKVQFSVEQTLDHPNCSKGKGNGVIAIAVTIGHRTQLLMTPLPLPLPQVSM